MNEYMERNYAGQPILDVYRHVRIPASKADIWRYCVLYHEGGIYCDIDSILTVPLNRIIASDYTELISNEEISWNEQLLIGDYADPEVFLPEPPEEIKQYLDYPDKLFINWMLIFEQGNPILAETIDIIVRHFDFYRGRKFESVRRAVVHFTGPVALTQAVWQWIKKTGKRPQQCGINYDRKGIFKLPVPYAINYEKNTGMQHYSQIYNSTIA
jgi:mannosyltransferase OCH1-like enzyme